MSDIPHAAFCKLNRQIHYVPESGCHLFAGTQNAKGYGVIKVGNKNYAAHRVSWIREHGPIPDKLSVLHKCDTPACCNPLHLFLGTNKNNVDDCVAKGRRYTKLKPSQVLDIRSGKYSIRSLAKRFGVARRTISDAMYGITWNECMRSEYER